MMSGAELAMVGMASKIKAVAQRLRAGVAGGDWREVKNGKWDHESATLPKTWALYGIGGGKCRPPRSAVLVGG
jgi:hypothetical protein